jgi:molybdopterin-guanine dinucleotide biosynthesis protein B
MSRPTKRTAPPIVCFVGRSGVGKTTVIESVVAELKRRGIRVGVVKHDAHDFEMDRPGKDTWRFSQAGADAVAISSPKKVALIEQVRQEWPLAEVVALLNLRVDIVLAEGYKRDTTMPKVEVSRAEVGGPLLCSDEELWAVVADWAPPTTAPRFELRQVSGLVDFLLKKTGLAGGRPATASPQRK